MESGDFAKIGDLLKGIRTFQTDLFPIHSSLFQELSDGQSPTILFITCSDSRIVPSLITHTGPGDLFVVRNAGNFVPTHDSGASSEAAAIEFAVGSMGVSDVVICGHYGCMAVQALLDGVEGLPAFEAWLRCAESTRERVLEKGPGLGESELWALAVEENVKVQMEQLRTHSVVAAGERAGTLAVHGWVYDIGSGNMRVWSEEQQQFVALG